MAELLVSVRSAGEAAAALAGGAALIDVKEPANGSLGRAADETIVAVTQFVARRRPVSAALGEFRESAVPPRQPGLTFVKWGLAGCRETPDWPRRLSAAAGRLRGDMPGCEVVAVAYADCEQAQAPDPVTVLEFARTNHWAVLLVDTWRKDGRTLLDWLTVADIGHLCGRCRAAGVRVALAGSLGPREIERLWPLEPDWFAVRSAACREGRRGDSVCPERVRHLARLAGRGSQLPCNPSEHGITSGP